MKSGQYQKASKKDVEEVLKASNDQITEDVSKWRDDFHSRVKICAYCEYNGFLLCTHNETGEVFAFRCDKCDAARRQHFSQSIPEWDSSRMIHVMTPLVGRRIVMPKGWVDSVPGENRV